MSDSGSMYTNTSFKRLIFFTGRPGVGKTTVLMSCIQALKAESLKVGGMVSREIRSKGIRVGFEVIDIASGEVGVLAHVEQREGPRIGKYRVNLRDLNRVGVNAIIKAVNESDVIVIDEVGVMELLSREFKEAVMKAVNSKKLLLGTMHFKAKDPLISLLKKRNDITILEVSIENRDRVAKTATDLALTYVKSLSRPAS